MHSVLRKPLLVLMLVSPALWAQVPVGANPDQQQMLAGGDVGVRANKRLVYDFWREVFEGGHLELADHYLAESYVQHNPNVPTGRAAFVELFGKVVKPKAIDSTIAAPLVAIVGEGDLVVLAFARAGVDPRDPTSRYTTTWFDMFRIENGNIAEHWDPATRK